MSVYRPGDQVPWSSRPENQPVTVTRSTWHYVLRRLEDLERRLAVLEGTGMPQPVGPLGYDDKQNSTTAQEGDKHE